MTHAQKPELVQPALKLIRPLTDRIESDQYSLGRVRNLNPEEAKRVISLATGQTVKRIIPVSMSKPFPRPEWMTEAVYQRTICGSLNNNLWEGLWDSLGMTFGTSLRINLGYSLRNSLGQSLMDNLRIKFRASLGTSLMDNFRFGLGHNIWDSLYYYHGFVLAGDTTTIRRLEPTISFMAKGYSPLAQKVHEPSTVLVSVA